MAEREYTLEEIQGAPAEREYSLEEIQGPPQGGISLAESFARGGGQGGTAGFSDEAIAGLRRLAGGDYDKLVAEERLKNELARKANPFTYGAGELLGGLGMTFIPGIGLAKGASLAKNIKNAATLGGLAGAGYAGSGVEETLKGAATGGVMGAGLGGLGHVASQGLQKAGRAMFNRPFSQIDEALAQKGKMPLSDLFWDEGLTPRSNKQMVSQTEGLLTKYTQQKDKIVDTLEKAGVKGNIDEALSEVQTYVNSLKAEEPTKEFGHVLQKELDRYYEKYRPVAGTPGRPATITRKSQFIPQEPQPAPTNFDLPLEQNTMPNPGYHKGKIVYDPLSKTRIKIPAQPEMVPQTHSVFHPENIVDYDKFTGAPVYQREVKPVSSYLFKETPETVSSLQGQLPFKTDPRTGLPIKEIIENRIKGVPATPGINPISFKHLEMERQLGNAALSESAFEKLKRSSIPTKFSKIRGGGILKHQMELANKVAPGLGNSLKEIGNKQSALLSAAKRVKGSAVTEAGRHAGTQVTAMAAVANPSIAVANELARLGKFPALWTHSGRALGGGLLSQPALRAPVSLYNSMLQGD